MNLIMFYINKSINLIKLIDQGWVEFVGGQGLSIKINSLRYLLNVITAQKIKLIILFILFIVV